MAKRINRLNDRAIAAFKDVGYRADGGGLYLQCSKYGTKSWVFRFTRNGRAREMGLGSVLTFSLAEARAKARECRQLLDQGVDPIEHKRAERAHLLGAAEVLTFDECAKRYITAHKSGWRNLTHADQWQSTITTYCSPVIGKLPVSAIDTGMVMRVLQPLWDAKKIETGTRLRGRIENILAWASVQGYRQGDNPARWRGHLDKLLPKRSKVAPVKHRKSLPYAQMPQFMTELRSRKGVTARAVEFIALTAARVGEVAKSSTKRTVPLVAPAAIWDEIDLAAKVWVVPAERMKGNRDHFVPLSDAAVAVLEEMKAQRQSRFVFPGAKAGTPITGAACLNLLHDIGYDVDTHGFRSTFRTWAAEQTSFPREIAETALAHAIKDKTEAAYQRGDLLERRRKLMQAWASYCSKKPTENVVQLNRA